MPLSKYAQQAASLAEEASSLLDAAQQEVLRASLSQASRSAWYEWKGEHSGAVAGFLVATPAERRRKYQQHPDYSRLVLAVYERCRDAQGLLRVLSQHRLEPGLSYRDMALEAAEAFDQLMELPLPDWPFDCPAPWRD